MNNLRPLRLGRTSAGHSPAPTPVHTPDNASENVPDVQLAYMQDGGMAAMRPAPSPPFRLLPPSAPGSTRVESIYRPDPERLTPSIDPMRAMLPDASSPQSQIDDRGDLRMQLRSRPLTNSFLGQKIIGLLTHPWVIAPSGLAACRFPDDASDEDISDVASAINLLNCGAEALAHPAAGVLAVSNLDKLNSLMARCGISAIIARPCPENWPPLAARSPAPFLMTGFQMRRMPEGRENL